MFTALKESYLHSDRFLCVTKFNQKRNNVRNNGGSHRAKRHRHLVVVLLLNARTQPSFDQTDDGVDAETSSFSLSASLSLFSALTLSSHAHLWSLKLSLKMRVSSNELFSTLKTSGCGPQSGRDKASLSACLVRQIRRRGSTNTVQCNSPNHFKTTQHVQRMRGISTLEC